MLATKASDRTEHLHLDYDGNVYLRIPDGEGNYDNLDLGWIGYENEEWAACETAYPELTDGLHQEFLELRWWFRAERRVGRG